MPGLTRVETVVRRTSAWYGLIDYGGGTNTNNATVDRRYTVAHANGLDLSGTTGWSRGRFALLSQNAGTTPQYMLNAGSFQGNPSFSSFGTGSGQTNPSGWFVDVSDASADHEAGAASSLTLDQLTLVVEQYDPATDLLELYICTPGEAAVLADSTEATIGDMVAPTDWHIGARSDLDADRYWTGMLGGEFAASRPLTTGEIAQLATGISPVTLLGDDCVMALAFANGAQATEPDLSGNGNDATRHGVGWEGQSGVLLDDFAGREQTSSADPWTPLTLTLSENADYILAKVAHENNVVPAAVTAGGVAMNAGAVAGPVASSSTFVRLYWLDNTGDFPEPGEISIVVDPASSLAGYVGAWSLIGAKSGAPNRTHAQTGTGAGQATTTLDDVPAGAFIAGGANSNAVALTVAGEDVEDFIATGAQGGQVGGFCHNLPASSGTISHAWDGNDRIAALMAEVLPA